jgi:hypothetical protein
MGRASNRKKDINRHKAFKILRESKDQIQSHMIGDNSTMALNPLKHLLLNKPYKNKQCIALIRETLIQFQEYMKQNNYTDEQIYDLKDNLIYEALR